MLKHFDAWKIFIRFRRKLAFLVLEQYSLKSPVNIWNNYPLAALRYKEVFVIASKEVFIIKRFPMKLIHIWCKFWGGEVRVQIIFFFFSIRVLVLAYCSKYAMASLQIPCCIMPCDGSKKKECNNQWIAKQNTIGSQ